VWWGFFFLFFEFKTEIEGTGALLRKPALNFGGSWLLPSSVFLLPVGLAPSWATPTFHPHQRTFAFTVLLSFCSFCSPPPPKQLGQLSSKRFGVGCVCVCVCVCVWQKQKRQITHTHTRTVLANTLRHCETSSTPPFPFPPHPSLPRRGFSG